MSRLQFRLALLIAGVASLALRALVAPVSLYGAMFDDELMVRQAVSILNGDWLGDINNIGHVGLSKPPGYALFLVLTSPLPWAPTVSVHIILLMGLGLVCRELRHLGISRVLVFGSFLTFALYPVWFNEQMSRIYRDGFLGALAFCLIGLSLTSRRLIRSVIHSRIHDVPRVGLYIRNLVLTILLTGLIFSWFVITKNSWHFLAIMILGVFITTMTSRQEIKKSSILLVAGSLCSVFALSTLTVASIAQINYKHYGVRQIDTYSSGPFADAMKVMYGVEDSKDRPYVDITAEMRDEMYQVSPTLALLRKYLELPPAQGWRGSACQAAVNICDESSAWFPWDLRDAVQASGLGSTPKAFNQVFNKISEELRDGCSSGRIACESYGLAPGLDSLDSLSPRAVINGFFYGVGVLLNPDSGRQTRAMSQSMTSEQDELWSKVVKDRAPITFSSQIEANAYFLSDVRQLIGHVYSIIWPIIVLLGLLGIVGQIMKKRFTQTSSLAIVLLISTTVLVLQLSMIEASSGSFMIPGGWMYLISVMPVFMVAISLGIHELLPKQTIEDRQKEGLDQDLTCV